MIIEKSLNRLKSLITLQDKVSDIHCSIKKLYPIAIASGGAVYLFDYDEKNESYVFIKEHRFSDIIVPDEIRAAFPLDFYDDKIAAVAGLSVFENIDEMVTILHEFVHCWQYETCEKKIKDTLLVAKKSMEEKNGMWEINYPFPYGDDFFAEQTAQLEERYKAGDIESVYSFYKDMKDHLSVTDYEYMIWQELKEGFARYIENKIRAYLGLKLNESPISNRNKRVMFYEMGARHIDLIIREHGCGDIRLNKLYSLMSGA